MIRPHKFQRVDGYTESTNDYDFVVHDFDCLDIDGTHFCAANGVRVGSNATAVTLLVDSRQIGLVFRLAPDGARSVAAALVKGAARLEKAIVQQANAQLAAALAKNGDAS